MKAIINCGFWLNNNLRRRAVVGGATQLYVMWFYAMVASYRADGRIGPCRMTRKAVRSLVRGGSIACFHEKAVAMTDNVSLERLESTVNLVHFQSTEYLSTLVKDKMLHFQNASKYSQEVNIVSIDSEFYNADSIGIFCFSYDMKAVFDADMWHRFGTKTGLRSVCVGFWEAGAEAVANTSGTIEHAIELSKRNHRKMINTHHNMSEPVYVGRPDYITKGDLENYKNLPLLTKRKLEMAREIMLLTFEPDELALEYEERFIVFDCPDCRDVSYPSRFVRRPKLIILGPEVQDSEIEQFVEEYRNHVTSIWKARIGPDGTVAVLRAWN